MTAEVRLNEPPVIYAGINIEWEVDEPDYTPADGWQMVYYLTKDGAQITIDSSDNGTGRRHLIRKTAAQTADYTKDGEYLLSLVAIKSPDKIIIRQGTIQVKKNFITALDGFDHRSDIKKTLDLLEKSIQDLASETDQEISINGKMLKRYSLDEKLKLKKQYLKWYQEEQDKINEGTGEVVDKTIYVEFI